jgi:hypothetical protein
MTTCLNRTSPRTVFIDVCSLCNPHPISSTWSYLQHQLLESSFLWRDMCSHRSNTECMFISPSRSVIDDSIPQRRQTNTRTESADQSDMTRSHSGNWTIAHVPSSLSSSIHSFRCELDGMIVSLNEIGTTTGAYIYIYIYICFYALDEDKMAGIEYTIDWRRSGRRRELMCGQIDLSREWVRPR